LPSRGPDPPAQRAGGGLWEVSVGEEQKITTA